MRKRELEIIKSLGKLYPEFTNIHGDVFEYETCKNNYEKAWWVHWLCTIHLNQRLPRLEKFIKKEGDLSWCWYKEHFNLMDKQCGKEN